MPTTRESRGHSAVVDQEPTEEFIRRKAAELEAVFESLGDGLLVLNTSAFIVEANRTALALLGHTPEARHPRTGRERADARG